MKNVAIIVAHPDDETLWAGGTILSNPNWNWKIFCLTREDDPDRAPRFQKVLSYYGASGEMDKLPDDPDQEPLKISEVTKSIMGLIGPHPDFDLVITHGLKGEYTRHRRHEEVSFAVTNMWLDEELNSRGIWLFAYEDGDGQNPPRPEEGSERFPLSLELWRKKRYLVEEVYGFAPESWEARVNPRVEAFRKFETKKALREWLNGGENQ